jgi:hypothetical protein
MFGSKSSPHVVEKSPIVTPDTTDQPLTMTVHDLPMLGVPGVQRRVSGRLKMIAVLLVCAAPVIASYLMFYVVRPTAQRNYGTLISPAPGLPDLPVMGLDGAASNMRAFKGQWLLISVGSGACDAPCQQRIYLQRQLRESLGREKDRMDRVWLITDDKPVGVALVPQVQAANVDAYAMRLSATAVAQWLAPEAGKQLSDHLYLVDPMGHWMMRFPADIDAAKAKRDIERLLRAANSWDRAGRDKAVP